MANLEKNEQIKKTLAETRQRRSRQICRVYECKVDDSRLTSRQREEMKMLFVEGKRLYNHILNWSEIEGNDIFKFNHKDCWQTIGKDKDGNFINHTLSFLTSSLKATVLQSMCSSIKTISKLKKKGIQKHGGKLRFKSECKSLWFKQYKITHRFHGDNKIKLQGISGKIRIKGAKQFLCQNGIEIADCKLIDTPKGYYLKVTTFIDKDLIRKVQYTKESIAIDFGCTNSFNFSDGRKLPIKIEETERMKRLQKKLSRQVKRSNNFKKTSNLIGICYQKLSNKKKDEANKLVASLKEYKTVVIQDEQLQNWHKNGHGKAIQHSILGRVKAKLKALPNVVVLDRFIPTTKFCRFCGQSHEVSRWDKTVTCCGVTEDRDIHAAKNMEWIATVLCKPLVRLGQTEIKHVEFVEMLEAYVSNHEQTLKHEAAQSLAAL